MGYTTVCPSVRGDNPRALASEISPVQEDNRGIIILYTLINVDLFKFEIYRAEVCDFRQEWHNYVPLEKLCQDTVSLKLSMPLRTPGYGKPLSFYLQNSDRPKACKFTHNA